MRKRWRNAFWPGGDLPATEGWDGLRLGSEGCPALVPPAGAIAGTAGLPGAASLALVTSPASAGDLPGVLASARAALAAGWGEVVVNDWGVLDLLACGGGAGITAGRLLMRARRGPGESDPWPGLDGSSRAYFSWGPLLDPPFLDLLREMGVSRLELDPPRHWIPIPPTPGFSLNLHADNRLVTLAGNCPFLFDEKAGRWRGAGCERACALGAALLLSAPLLARPLLQSGKLVLEKAGLPERDLPAVVDRLVFSPNLFADLP